MCPFIKFKDFFNCLKRAIPVLIALASIATALIPNPSPETAEVLQKLHQVLDVIAVNVIHNSHEMENIPTD